MVAYGHVYYVVISLNRLRQEDYKWKLAGKDREQSPCLVSSREGLEIEFSDRVFT